MSKQVVAKSGKQKRRNVTLSDYYYELAKEVGEGNASDGLRVALIHYWNTVVGKKV